MCDWDLMAVWMSFINPTKFSLGMSVAQPPQKREEGREKVSIRDISMDGRKDVWDFVDLVSGYSHEASKSPNSCQIPKLHALK